MKKIITLILALIMITASISGCGGYDNTIQNIVVSNTSYTAENDFKSAPQPETLSFGEPIFASIYFIESPKGMEYTVKWYIDENEVKSETKATVNAPKDIMVYELEEDKASAGNLKIEVMYKDTVLFTKEIKIE